MLSATVITHAHLIITLQYVSSRLCVQASPLGNNQMFPSILYASVDLQHKHCCAQGRAEAPGEMSGSCHPSFKLG